MKKTHPKSIIISRAASEFEDNSEQVVLQTEPINGQTFLVEVLAKEDHDRTTPEELADRKIINELTKENLNLLAQNQKLLERSYKAEWELNDWKTGAKTISTERRRQNKS